VLFPPLAVRILCFRSASRYWVRQQNALEQEGIAKAALLCSIKMEKVMRFAKSKDLPQDRIWFISAR